MSKSLCVSLSAFTALVFVFNLQADTLYMTASDNGSGNSSFNTWDISGTPKGAPTSGNDYVCDAFNINAPNSGATQSFGGNSLRLGDVAQGKSANLILRRTSNTTVNFPNTGLILEGGSVQPWINTTTYGGKQYTFTGMIEVRSSLNSPFEFCITDKNKDHLGMTYVLTATFKGEAGTGVALVNRYDNPNGSVTLNPSVANFAGTFIVGGGSPAYAVKCNLQGSPVMPGGLWVKALGEVVPPDASTLWTVGSLRLDANSTLLTKLTNDPKTSTITVTDSLTTAYPVNLTFPSVRTVNTGTGYIWNVLTLPLEKKDQIHPEHFVLATQETVGMFPDAFPSVELRVAEKNDLAVLEVVQRQVVQNNVADDAGYGYSKQNFEFPTSMTNAMAWSNKNLPMPTIDYVAANNLNAATPSQCEDGVYTFPGASLTVNNGKVFCEAAHVFAIPVLRLENKAQFWPLGEQYDDATAYVKGRIHVLPTEKLDDGPIIRVRRQSTVDIEAELTGTGCLQVQPNANDSTDSVIVFDHDNSAFLGNVRIQANTYTNYSFTTGQTLVLKAANNVGGPLDAFTADALVIRRYSTLEVTNDVVFATANRGLTVENALIKVSADATFTFANDITYAGPLVKSGAGRLVLGGSALGSKKTLTVAEGTLAVSTDTALDGVAVTFTGGALAVDPETSGEYGMRGPFTGNLPVAFDLPADEETHEYANVAVCTVDASANVTPKAVRIPRHQVVFHWRDNGDDTKTLLADISRTGCAIILR